MTARARLALSYSVLFLTLGAALVAVSFVLISNNLPAHRFDAASGQDVVLRAAKLAQNSDANIDHALAAQIAAAPSDKAFALAASLRDTMSPRTYDSLTAGLAVNVRGDALHQLVVWSAVALGATTLASAALGWLIAGRVLRPLTRITNTARRASSDNLDERINLHGPDDELTRLAAAFDDMLNRLAVAFEGQRRFVANASHELRTPLTIMATEIDVTVARPHATNDDLRDMARTVRGTIDRSDRLISSLLALALVDEGLEISQQIDLATIAAESLERHMPAILDAQLETTSTLSETIVAGDPGLLDRMIDNLIENAVRYNTTPGWIDIRTSRARDRIILEIANSGPAVTISASDTLFEPFRRAQTRPGTHGYGLGLAIVRAIATAHQGTASATTIDAGGLRVTIDLPTGIHSTEP